jgi:manganese/iron transport system permease protein
MLDLTMLREPFMQRALLAALLAGVACPLLGVLVVTMRLSFIGVCMSHAAFAGALLGLLAGIEPLAPAFAFSLLAAAVLGPLADRGEFGPDTAMGIVFSSSLGLAFLLLALVPGPKTEALGLLWGSILTVSRANLALLAGVAAVVLALCVLFFKEIQAVIFNREIAVAVGIPATAIFYGLLLLSGAAITASLNAIGGLLVFSLIINPAAAAYQLTYSLRRMFILAAVFGVASGWVGLALSAVLDLPSGAVIIMVSVLIFVGAVIFSPKRRHVLSAAAERL